MTEARVIILGAGRGTRLQPLTDSIPKCLTTLAGQPLLTHQVSRFKEAGLDDVTIVTGYRKEAVEEFAKTHGVTCIENPEYESTNMVFTLFSAEDRFPQDRDLIISYGDIVFDAAVLRALTECRAEVCVPVDLDWQKLWSLRMSEPLDDAETLKFDADGRLQEIGQRPERYDDVQAQYLGLVKVRADRVDEFRHVYHGMDREAVYDGKDFNNMYMTSFIQHLIDTGWWVQAVPIRGGWLEVDTLDDLKSYDELYRRGDLERYIRL